MVNRICFFLLLSVLNPVFSQSGYFHVIDKKADHIILEWQSPGLTWQTLTWRGATFIRPGMGSLLLSQEKNKPGLPLDAFVLEVPTGLSAGVSVLDSVVTEESIAYPVASGSSTLSDSSAALAGDWSAAESYSHAAFLSIEAGRQRERSLLRLGLAPVQYNPQAHRVKCLRYLRLQITYSPVSSFLKKHLSGPPWKPEPGKTVKLALTEAGMYQVTGSSLQTAGVNIGSIVPGDIKLYYKGLEQLLSLTNESADHLSADDKIHFFAERRSGKNEYYDALGDTNVYWLTWSQGAGRRYSLSAADSASSIQDHLPVVVHLENDLNYYSGDTDLDIHDTETVPGEGWVWYIINRGGSFSLPFDLSNLYEGQDSITVRLRLRGTTLDPHTPDHHVQIYINQKKVHDFNFNDRDEVLPVFKAAGPLFKTRDNTLEIRSIADTEAERSQFYLDWVELSFQQRSSAVNGIYAFNGADLPQDQALYVDGFTGRSVSVWDINNGQTIDRFKVGTFYRSTLQVRSAGLSDGNYALFYQNNEELYRGGRGHSVVTLDGATGRVLEKRNFDTYGSSVQSDSMAAFLNRQLAATLVLVAVADDGSSSLTTGCKQALQRLGGARAGELKFRDSYVLISQVGADPKQVVEVLKLQGQGAATASALYTFQAASGRYSVQFSSAYQFSGKVVVFDSTAMKTPRIAVFRGTDLTDPTLAADYIIITHPLFQSSAQQIAEYRQRKNGFRTRVVLIDDIYNSFNFGLSGPQAIKDFLYFAYQNWIKPAPAYVLLLGDASWDPRYIYGKTGQNDYIPSYGNPVSDLWFVCFDGPEDMLPEMSIGRWPVETLVQAESMVEKIIEYESTPSAAWKKEFLFISGGFDYLEQSAFRGQSAALQNEFVQSPPVSGHSDMIQKTSLDFREGENRNEIMASLNSGKVWANFIGHAASRTWDLMFHNADIDLLDNAPRYPFVTSMTCHTGRFAQPDQISFGENFVLAPAKGAIAFLGTSGWGYSYEDYIFLRKLFPVVTRDSIRVLGKVIDAAKLVLWEAYGASRNVRDMVLQYNLLGDPATLLALPVKPDLALTPEDIQINPEEPSEADSTAQIQVRIHNYGLATLDSVDVALSAQHPTLGRTMIKSIRRPAIGRQDSVTIAWPLQKMTGAVDLLAVLDGSNKINEIDESNNQQERRVTVLSSRVVLIAPQEQAMTPYNGTVLKIQNPQVSRFKEQVFEFQIDTTAGFNSALLMRSGPVYSGPLATTWSPGMLQRDQNYFWSVANLSNADENYTMSGQFFSSAEGLSGWRQDLTRMNENRVMQDLEQTSQGLQLYNRSLGLLVQSAGFFAGHYAIIDMQGEPLMTTERGYNVVVLDRKTARVLTARHFDTYGDGKATTAMAELLESLTDQQLVLMAISDDGSHNNERTWLAIESLGSTQCRQIQFRDSWAFIGYKGAAKNEVIEQYMPSGTSEAVVLDTLKLFSEQGSVQTSAIGPAKQWGQLAFSATVPDSAWLELVIWGRNKRSSRVDTLLRSRTIKNTLELTEIPADQYPFIFLQARLGTTDGHFSPLVKNWQVQFLPTADLAIGPAVLKQNRDSVLVGGSVALDLTVYNIGLQPSDSVLVQFQEYDPVQGYRTFATARRTNPLAADSFWTVAQTWTAIGKSGPKQLLITVDPLNDVTESVETNNTVTTTILVLPDSVKPQILVTYDDREIVAGDLVAREPRILITVLDNSPVALQDSSRVLLWLDGKRVYYKSSSSTLQWQPVRPGVSAILEYKPTLKDGPHYLEVTVLDPSANAGSRRDEFKVESELKLLRVMNYPNPFSEQTEITFELTQPAQVSVKIFTVAGRMIRELESSEQSAGFCMVHWDGRDADGDDPANGVYLIKVSARIDEKRVEEIVKAVRMR
jgi:hypothetical protein